MFKKMAGTRIAQIVCDRDVFDVTNHSCFLNGVDVIDSKDDGYFGALVGNLVLSACHTPNMEIKVKHHSSSKKFADELVDTLSKSDQAKVKVLEESKEK